MGKSKKQTVSSGLDPQTQRYVNNMRGVAQNAAENVQNMPGNLFLGPNGMPIEQQAARFMNPYQDQVIRGVRNEFDYLRANAASNAGREATLQGAFGGSRAAVAQGVRLGALDRAEASQIGQMMHQGWGDAVNQGLAYSEYERSLRERMLQEPMWRNQQALNFLNLGMGPYGTTNTSQQPRNWLGGAAGGAMMGSAIPGVGTVVGGVLGGLFGG